MRVELIAQIVELLKKADGAQLRVILRYIQVYLGED